MAQEDILQNNIILPDDEKSNFDIMEWVFRILHYWYLFVIAGIIAFSLAYVKNKRVIASYLTSGTVIIQEPASSNAYGASALMQGFGMDAGYKNVNNQLIIMGSYDLIARTVDSLPFMNVEYITRGRFKTRNIYRSTPILVEHSYLAPTAYQYLFKCTVQDDGTLMITDANEQEEFKYIAQYGKEIETPFFTATIWPTELMMNAGQHIYFRFRSREDLTQEFSSRLQLRFITEQSTVLSIQLVGVTPERDRDFINKLADIYLLQSVERKNMVADKTIEFINEQLEVLQVSLSQSETAMTDFRQENKFVDVGSYANELMQKGTQYEQQHLALRLKETYLDYLTNYLDQKIAQGTVIFPASLGLNEPVLMQLVQQLNDLQIQRGELSEKNVFYAKYTTDIQNVKAAIAESVNSMRISLNIEKTDLQNRMKDLENQIQHLPAKELEMVSIERNYRIDDNYYTFFLQKRAEAEIQKARNTPDSEVMERARTTYAMNTKEKRKNMTTYMIIGMIIPLLIIVLSELVNNKVRTPKEAEKLSDFNLLGSTRHVASQNPLFVKLHPRSSFAEMLRNIRMRVEFIVQRKSKITLTVTSTQSGDGKTFLSTNFAALYAMSGRPTLLIDLDVRKPNVHDKLGIEVGYGVTNYIIGDCTLDDIIVKHPSLDFDFIPAGTIPPNPGELIRSEKLTEMLNLMKERYDFIVIDTSPVGIVPDAMSLVEQTDLTLFVIRCMQTNKVFAKQTLEALSINHSDKINLILSDIPNKKSKLSYGGYGSYGYGAYGSGYGYGYGAYGSNPYKNSRKYGRIVDYYRHRFSKNENHDPYNYIDDDEA